MANLAASKPRAVRYPGHGPGKRRVVLKVGAKYFAGSLLCVGADGLAVRGANAANTRPIGVLERDLDLTDTAQANAPTNTGVECGQVFVAAAGAVQADVGDLFHLSDDDTAATGKGQGLSAVRCVDVVVGVGRWLDFSDQVDA